MTIEYKINEPIMVDEFVDILRRSTLAERRPVSDRKCMEAMLAHGNLCVSAWDGSRLVGIGRALTDFEFICYVSELAVDRQFQGRGVGKEIMAMIKDRLGPRCTVRLTAAPAAAAYYPKIGFVKNERCWDLVPNSEQLKVHFSNRR